MNHSSFASPMIGRWAIALDTPALIIDLDAMEENIRRAASLAAKAGVELRPHIKTHKMPPVAHRQIGGGAVGITAAKIGEAEVMAANGIADIIHRSPVAGEPWGSRPPRSARPR